MKTFFKIFILFFVTSCANMIAPSGGPRDNESPKVSKTQISFSESKGEENLIMYEFDERIQDHKFEDNFYISPPLQRITHRIQGSVLEIKIKDSIKDNLLYTVCMDNCIKDFTEGNVLRNFSDQIIRNELEDTLIYFDSLTVYVQNARKQIKEENHWILLYKSNIPDSLVFNGTPDYISRTNQYGYGSFVNLQQGGYKLASVSGRDYIYHKNEIISIADKIITTKEDTLILFSINPLEKPDSIQIMEDSNDTESIVVEGGDLVIKTNLKIFYVAQLLKDDKIIENKSFSHPDIKFEDLSTGEYTVKILIDKNQNGFWDTGDFHVKRQPEKVFIYPEKITIRSNWDLELEWRIML